MAAFVAPSALCDIAKIMQNFNTDASLFFLTRTCLSSKSSGLVWQKLRPYIPHIWVLKSAGNVIHLAAHLMRFKYTPDLKLADGRRKRNFDPVS